MSNNQLQIDLLNKPLLYVLPVSAFFRSTSQLRFVTTVQLTLGQVFLEDKKPVFLGSAPNTRF